MKSRFTCNEFAMTVLALALAVLAVNATAGINDGLVAYYPFEGNCTDESGNAFHGTPHGMLVYDVGFRGLGASFDGIDDYVELPRMVEEDFTVVFRVRTTVVAPPGTEWWQGLGMVDAEVCGAPADGDWGIALLDYQSSGGGRVCWGSAPTGTVSTTEVNDDFWHTVVVTRSMIPDWVSVWIDGQEEGSGVVGLQIPLTGPDWIGVGNNPCDVSFNRLWFPGRIDELRFYDRVVSAFEIRALSSDFVFFDDFESGDLSAWSSVVP